MPRHPLPWLLAFEALALVALAYAGWRLVSDRLAPPPPSAAPRLAIALPLTRLPAAAPVPSPPVPTLPTARPLGPAPGLSTDPIYWQRELSGINRDESAWETIEWRAVQAVEEFARAYVDRVVIPAVQASPRGQRT